MGKRDSEQATCPEDRHRGETLPRRPSPDEALPAASPPASDPLLQALDATDEGICVVGADRSIRAVNRAFLEMVGRPPEDLIGRDCGAVLETDLCDGEGCPLRAILAAPDRPLRRRARLRGARSGLLAVEVHVRPWRGEGGAVLGAIQVYRDVSLQEAARAALVESERRFRTLVESTESLILRLDGELRMTYLNPAGSRILGFEPGEGLGERLIDRIHPEDREGVRRTFEDWIRRRIPSGSCRWRCLAPDGEERHVLALASLSYGEEGILREGILNGVEITELVHLSDEVRRLSAFPVLDPDMVLQLDPRGRVLYANPAAEDWLYARNSRQRKDLERLFPRDLRERIRAVLESDGSSVAEVEAEGRFWRFLLRAFPDRRSVMATVTDVTSLRRTAREREMYYQALQNALHGVCITDRNGRILYVNRTFADLYGYTPEQARGKNPRLLNPGRDVYRENGIDDEAYDRLFGGMWEALLDDRRGFWEGDLINRRRDGSLIWVRLYVSAIRDESGRAVAFFATPMDLTAKRGEEAEARLSLYRAITLTAEARDQETGAHLDRIGAYTRLLAERMGLGAKFRDDIALMSPFHDIGKVGIPDGILLAPRRLTPDELEIMRTHPLIGHNILKGRVSLEMAAEVALRHHEKWDGTGYPGGLAGEAIPLSARLTALADVYDALRSRRPYKEPWSHEEARAWILGQSGRHFDPSVAALFGELEGEFDRIFLAHRDEETESGGLPPPGTGP
jgi:PAS domain S-box-containing protein